MSARRTAETLVSIVALFVPVSPVFAAQVARAPSIAYYSRPLTFEPNLGQADSEVDSLAHGNGYTLFLAHGEAVAVLGAGKNSPSSVIRIKPVHASRAPRADFLEPLPGTSNYFIGNDPAKWHTRVPNFSRVRYRAVYPGIDLVYYGNQRQLEYDFIVAPGADPGAISLAVDGPAEPSLDREGDLVMHTAAGDLSWHKPVAYQQVNGSRKIVECGYVRTGKRLGFAIGAYDATVPLVIDPVLVYSTYLGGSGTDAATAIAVDGSGNAYLTGFTSSTDFPNKAPFQSSLKSPQFNAFVTKLDAAGEALVYSTYLGGSGVDNGTGIAVDQFGEAYAAGFTSSTDFPTKNAFQGSLKSTHGNAFLTKFAANGSGLVFSTYLGGTGGDSATKHSARFRRERVCGRNDRFGGFSDEESLPEFA